MDAMQDVFVKVTEHRTKLNADAPSSLLYRIATNHCLNILRDNKRWVHGYDENNDNENETLLMHIAKCEDSTEQVIAKNILDKLFRRHPESTRTIAVLHFYDGMTLEEVADHVGMSVSGVRKRLRVLQESLQALRGAA